MSDWITQIGLLPDSKHVSELMLQPVPRLKAQLRCFHMCLAGLCIESRDFATALITQSARKVCHAVRWPAVETGAQQVPGPGAMHTSARHFTNAGHFVLECRRCYPSAAYMVTVCITILPSRITNVSVPSGTQGRASQRI